MTKPRLNLESDSDSDRFADAASLLDTLGAIRSAMLGVEKEQAQLISELDPSNHASACNLLHYIGLRRSDIRDTQKQLASMGLSSLGRAEAHVLDTVDSVLDVLRRLADRPGQNMERSAHPLTFSQGRLLLEQKTRSLLGNKPIDRFVRIMITMPTEAADDPSMLVGFLKEGMDCMRINCAHDGPEEWARMIENLRAAQMRIHRSCRILMDLPGPKLRTGEVEGEPTALHVRPERDAMGRVTRPARAVSVARFSIRR